MVGFSSFCASIQNFSLNGRVLRDALKTSQMTKELLNSLLRLWPLPTCDEYHSTRVEWLAALTALRDASAAKTTLKLKVIGVNAGHTI